MRFEVEDRGVGVSPEIQSGLFQLFNQGDNSSTRRYGGTGMGLALCQRLVALMGGEIALVSTPGEGTTVGFWVPLGIGGETSAPGPYSVNWTATAVTLSRAPWSHACWTRARAASAGGEAARVAAMASLSSSRKSPSLHRR